MTFTSMVQFASCYYTKPLQLHQVSFKGKSHFLTEHPQNDSDSKSSLEAQKAPRPSGQRTSNKQPWMRRKTHFLCFPLVTNQSIPQLAASLKYFRQVATKPNRESASLQQGENHCQSKQNAANTTDEDCKILHHKVNMSQCLPSINPDLQILPAIAHRPPGTFHLTLGVMDLSSKERMSRALELLQNLDYADILQSVLPQQVKENNSTPFDKNNPLRIMLTGLSTFPSSKKSRVFYAKPSSSPLSPFPLLKFGQAICKEFQKAGLIIDSRPLILHATLANMRYAIQANRGHKRKGKTGKERWAEGQVDATALIQCFNQYGGDTTKYKNEAFREKNQANEFIWAKDVELNRVAICKMGAQKSEDKVLGQVYPPVGEKLIYS
ncbi:unnamed protein product [Bemisia tabaci]|uniref:A-kinase anchor protein 7-like phosphoesterase domain-containing protein n=1 Tax=Bemisia tabaci TaxID=7038 RepID=A0A9P0EYI4_BEMTA|nr:unnamed protein product [Bemisia tabaci]